MNEGQRPIPSIALAMMAWHLAGKRTPGYEDGFTEVWEPTERQMAEGNPTGNPISAEYYRIIDRIARGEKP